MAFPRVFISSTFYDLRQVRADLERMIRDLGYEPVRNETGAIPYPQGDTLETSAYREVDLCDILVSIIGGRYGTESREYPNYSISQNELKRALDRGVQVFIFVEANVLAEYDTFKANRENITVKYASVDDKRVFEFLDEVYRLPRNNALSPFKTSDDIVGFLRKQWAGLFQRYLSEQSRGEEYRVLEQMIAVAKTLQEVVSFLTEERKNRDIAIKQILMANHPVFRRLASLTNTPYRVFFDNKQEMDSWLTARGWVRTEVEFKDSDSIDEWRNEKMKGYIKFTTSLFDGHDRLIIFTEDSWDDSWVTFHRVPQPQPAHEEDDIPF